MDLTSHYHPEIAASFTKNTADHVMTVVHNDGLYRHLRFAPPRGYTYGFDLVTWPGHLAITGDMGALTFARLEDMTQFFASGGDINPGYWAQKIQDLHGAGVRGVQEFSERRFRQNVVESYRMHVEAHLGEPHLAALKDRIRDDVLFYAHDEHEALSAVQEFDFDGGTFRFDDAWEWDVRDFSHRFLWLCCAIRTGVLQYREAAR